jgi:hypothetical protein
VRLALGTLAGELLKKGPNGPVVIVPMFSPGRVNLYEGTVRGDVMSIEWSTTRSDMAGFHCVAPARGLEVIRLRDGTP